MSSAKKQNKTRVKNTFIACRDFWSSLGLSILIKSNTFANFSAAFTSAGLSPWKCFFSTPTHGKKKSAYFAKSFISTSKESPFLTSNPKRFLKSVYKINLGLFLRISFSFFAFSNNDFKSFVLIVL